MPFPLAQLELRRWPGVLVTAVLCQQSQAVSDNNGVGLHANALSKQNHMCMVRQQRPATTFAVIAACTAMLLQNIVAS